MHTFKRFAIAVMLMGTVLSAWGTASADSTSAGLNTLKLKKNSAVMLFNGSEMKAAQPVTIRDGSAYLPLRGIADPFGYKLSYDTVTKEAVAKSDQTELRFKDGSPFIKVNGQVVKGPGPVFAQHGHMMIPVRMWSNLTGARISAVGADIVITWQDARPDAAFEIGPNVIYAEQTPVEYIDKAGHPGGLRIVEEKWEGRYDVFPYAGEYTITRQVRDEAGVWSEPYAVTVSVRPPNQPPIADFATDKTVYRIGEPVMYTDLSADDEDAIKHSRWTGKQDAYFEAGEKQVTLEVEDQHGLTHSVTKTITITAEVLYTKPEFDRLFTEAGGKFGIDGALVTKEYDTVSFDVTNEPVQLVRSNSPEMIRTTGVAYDTLQRGKSRFLIYNQSAMSYNVNVYLLATNVNSFPVDIGVGAYGVGGPDRFSTNAGKMSTLRYLDAVNKKTPLTYTTVAPGETTILLAKQLSNVPIKPDDVFSAYADIESNEDVRYRVVFVPQGTDPIAALDSISLMPRDGLHTRGTFDNANRTIELTNELGQTKQRIMIGDRTFDKYLDGIDYGTGQIEYNLGNFGVLYTMKVRVAPRTLITLNARGGHYTGAFVVNGKVVEVTKGSMLKDRDEAVVLYRTGPFAETVELVFTPASGSNLPIALLFEPLPLRRA